MTLEKAIKQKKFKNASEKLIVNLFFTSSWLENCQNKILKKFDLAVPQYNVLRIIRGQTPHPTNIATISERMIYRMSNASRIVDRLEKKGLVYRENSLSDKRSIDIFITDKGKEMLEEISYEQTKFEVPFGNLKKQDIEHLNRLLELFQDEVLSKMKDDT